MCMSVSCCFCSYMVQAVEQEGCHTHSAVLRVCVSQQKSRCCACACGAVCVVICPPTVCVCCAVVAVVCDKHFIHALFAVCFLTHQRRAARAACEGVSPHLSCMLCVDVCIRHMPSCCCYCCCNCHLRAAMHSVCVMVDYLVQKVVPLLPAPQIGQAGFGRIGVGARCIGLRLLAHSDTQRREDACTQVQHHLICCVLSAWWPHTSCKRGAAHALTCFPPQPNTTSCRQPPSIRHKPISPLCPALAALALQAAQSMYSHLWLILGL